MVKHTPGPWKIEENLNEGDVFRPFFIIGQDAFIAEISDPLAPRPLPQSEVIANAKLIAAAPDMLEALETIIEQRERDYLDCDIYPYSLAKEAIDKATF